MWLKKQKSSLSTILKKLNPFTIIKNYTYNINHHLSQRSYYASFYRAYMGLINNSYLHTHKHLNKYASKIYLTDILLQYKVRRQKKKDLQEIEGLMKIIKENSPKIETINIKGRLKTHPSFLKNIVSQEFTRSYVKGPLAEFFARDYLIKVLNENIKTKKEYSTNLHTKLKDGHKAKEYNYIVKYLEEGNLLVGRQQENFEVDFFFEYKGIPIFFEIKSGKNCDNKAKNIKHKFCLNVYGVKPYNVLINMNSSKTRKLTTLGEKFDHIINIEEDTALNQEIDRVLKVLNEL